MKYRQLAQAAFILPNKNGFGTHHIGVAHAAGTIVGVLEPDDDDFDAENRLGIPDEIPVQFLDSIERTWTGWLARNTLLHPAKQHTLYYARGSAEDLALKPLDQLRAEVSIHGARDPMSHWTIASWCCMFGVSHVKLLYDVVRELGGRTSPDSDIETLVTHTVRLITSEEVTMSAEATATPKTKGAKKGAAKKSVKAEAPARSMSRTVGATLVPLMGKHKEGLVLAKRLANDETLTKNQLTALRDAVNEAAGAAREAEDDKLAAGLSNANKLVRRLARK